VLAIYILPYRWSHATILIFGFLLGLSIDLVNHTMGIHAMSTTFLAYIRPRLLLLTFNNEQLDDIHGKQKIGEFRWFFKYALISTVLFNIIMIFSEVFSFQNMMITLLRILCSTFCSLFFMMVYYFITLKKRV
jgi:hypothetical protein